MDIPIENKYSELLFVIDTMAVMEMVINAEVRVVKNLAFVHILSTVNLALIPTDRGQVFNWLTLAIKNNISSCFFVIRKPDIPFLYIISLRCRANNIRASDLSDILMSRKYIRGKDNKEIISSLVNVVGIRESAREIENGF